MPKFFRGVLALAAASLMMAASAAARTDYSGPAFNILAPGESGGIPANQFSTDQGKLYDALTPLQGNITAADLSKYYLSEKFGVVGPVIRREQTGRPGLRILRDKNDIPEGSHIVGVEEFAAPRRRFTSDEWREIKRNFTENLLREWSRYAPNMTAENVIASRVYSPEDLERARPNMIEGGYSTGSTIASQLGRFRPIPGLTGHRLSLENLYDCSANLHSGSGIGRGSSLNCFHEIARALHLDEAAVAA